MKIAVLGVTLGIRPSGGERRRIEFARRFEERGYNTTLYVLDAKVNRAWRGIKLPSEIERYRDRPIEADFIFAADLVTGEYFTKAKGRKIWMISYYWPGTEIYLKDPAILKLAQSSWHADWLKRKFDQEAVKAIGGVDTTFFNPPGPSIRYNQEKRTGVVLGQVGRCNDKNYKLIELAFGNIQGDGLTLEPLQANSQYELRAKYRKALFFLTAENYPIFCWNNPAAEAMACGCPVIALDHPATKDHCLHEKTAEVVNPRVPSIVEALTQAMQRLIDDEDYRNKLADNAWRYIHNFSYEKVVDVIENEILKAPKKPKITGPLKLNLGCGEAKKEGYVNIDNREEVNPDLLVDLEEAKLPYRTSSVDEIYTSHLLEHIHNFIPLMEELYRVLKPNGKVVIYAPYGLSEGGIGDPTHAHGTPLAPRTFDYFDKSHRLYSIYNFNCDLKVIKAERRGDDVFGIIDLYAELQAIKQIHARVRSQKKRISFFPSNNINAGGSRHSCYQVADGLRKIGYETSFDDGSNTDVAIFEKRFDRELAENLKKRGAKIVLVCCDPVWLAGLEDHILNFLKTADCVVVSSNKLARWYKERVKRIKVIREGFDWKNIPKVNKEPKFTLCWHGTSYTINHGCLELLVEPLNRLKKNFDFNFKIIVDLPLDTPKIPKFDFEPQVIQWQLDNFLPEIAKCHVGLSPELNDEWCSYKSFGKPINYMGLGLVPVLSPVPSYGEIILNGKNGFIIKDNDPGEWYEALKTLIVNEEQRSSIIEEGRKLGQVYTLEHIAEIWDKLLKTL